jgi:hypothetical protein
MASESSSSKIPNQAVPATKIQFRFSPLAIDGLARHIPAIFKQIENNA